MFYENVKKLCKERNTTITKMSESIGLSNAAATSWKKGSVPKASTLEKISEYFGVSVDCLLEKSEKKPLVIDTTIGPSSISEAVWIAAQNYGAGNVQAVQQAVERRDPLMDPEVLFALFGGADNITPEMIEDVKQFAQYVRQKKEQQEK